MSIFELDAYKGWSEEALKRRCRELVRIAMRKDIIIAVLAKWGHHELSADDQTEVERICSQWED